MIGYYIGRILGYVLIGFIVYGIYRGIKFVYKKLKKNS